MDVAQKDLEISKSFYWPTISAFFNYNTRETDVSRVSQFTDPDNPITTTQIGYVGSSGEAVLADIPNTSLIEVPALAYGDQLSNNDSSSDADLILHLAKETKNSIANISKLVKKERSKFLNGIIPSKEARKMIAKYIKTGW